MQSQPNARLTTHSLKRLLRRHIDDVEPLNALAAQPGNCFAEAFGYSLRTAYKWLGRDCSGGHTSLADRRSVRRSQLWTLDPQQLQQALDLRHQGCTHWRIAKSLGASCRPWDR